MKINSIILLTIPILFAATSCSEPAEEKKEVKNQHPLVKLDKVEIKKFIHEIRIQGNVETDKDVLLTAEMGGQITKVNVKEGQKVSKGQTIAMIDASILSSNVQELKTSLEYAEYLLGKQKELKKRGVGSEFELETAKNQVKSLQSKLNSLNTQRGKSIIRAPFTGIIDNVFARKGQMAGPQTPIVRLVNNEQVDIIASLSEKHIANVKVGTPIVVSFPNYMDTSILLKVTNVGNYIEPTNRTFRIMSSIKNNSFLLPNMLAELAITDMEIENGIVIPSKGILKDQDNLDFVFVATKKGNNYEITKVNVVVLKKYRGESLIKEGLKESQLIVSEGARGVSEGDIVRNK
ncbi:MAG TPA: efflux RND transporter periplasmic adaptor subunit [Crocinitomicaceae bacterium]|nr:efflux RND transporter periplasmic adaptor subunit [Crocinitomicaceae bacterium]